MDDFDDKGKSGVMIIGGGKGMGSFVKDLSKHMREKFGDSIEVVDGGTISKEELFEMPPKEQMVEELGVKIQECLPCISGMVDTLAGVDKGPSGLMAKALSTTLHLFRQVTQGCVSPEGEIIKPEVVEAYIESLNIVAKNFGIKIQTIQMMEDNDE